MKFVFVTECHISFFKENNILELCRCNLRIKAQAELSFFVPIVFTKTALQSSNLGHGDPISLSFEILLSSTHPLNLIKF